MQPAKVARLLPGLTESYQLTGAAATARAGGAEGRIFQVLVKPIQTADPTFKDRQALRKSVANPTYKSVGNPI